MIELNKVYLSDNLKLMNRMTSNSIDLIYSDILYGTGKKFTNYQDLKPDREVIEEFYIPRIKEMHRLLKPTGSIYLQMDWRINHWVRFILDDIFGYENFINEIIWWHKRGGNGKYFLKRHDNILFYAKNNKQLKFNKLRGEKYNYNGKSGQGKLLNSYAGDLPYPKELIEHLNNGQSNFNLDVNGAYLCDIWQTTVTTYHTRNYDTQKPLELMDKIVKASSNEGDLVADFFMGSGSFIVKAKELNRDYIGCDINPKAVKITNLRLIS